MSNPNGTATMEPAIDKPTSVGHALPSRRSYCRNCIGECTVVKVVLWIIVFVTGGFALSGLIYLLITKYWSPDSRSTPDDGIDAWKRCRNDTVFENSTRLLLPRFLQPIAYDVTLNVPLSHSAMNFAFSGNVEIRILCTNSTRMVAFHSKDLEIGFENVIIFEYSNRSNQLHVKSVEYDEYSQTNTLILGTCLKHGQIYVLQITNFTGRIHTDGKGFYLSRYMTSSNETRYLAATQFEVAEARRAFPCFDEPKFKANFTITIIRRKNMISLSNMKLVQSVSRNDDYVEDHYATSVKMSTYLVAFVVCDFKYKEAQSKRGVTVRAFARPDYVEETEHALKTAVKLLDYFEDYFDIFYALEKLDLIALPDFSHGAMENWGLITFKEATMLFDPNISITQQRETVSMIVGHELAHQWFGNLVTMFWWNDLWLNEAFAHYMGYASAEKIYTKEPMEHVYILSNVLEALKLDSMASTHPVLFNVLHPLEIVQFFDTITYKKGSCLVRMMANFLGAETLKKGLQIYLRSNAYKNTISNDLWNALDLAVEYNPIAKRRMEGLSVNTVMDNWIRLTGHPVVTVIRDYQQGTATLSQKRMKQHLNTSIGDDGQLWVVPFTYTTSDNLNWTNPSFVWLQNKTKYIQQLPKSESWIVGNVNFQGFYRVNYDEANWKLLFEQLKVNHLAFTESQRAQILSDSFDFSSADILDITLALNATEYLIKETEFLPWMVALKNFHYIDVMMQTTRHYDLFKAFMRKQLDAMYNSLGWEQKPTDSKHIIYLRYAVIDQSCHYENIECLKKTSILLQSWMQAGDLEKISVELKPLVKCYGVASGGNEEINFVIKELKDAKAAMCSKDPAVLEKILTFGLNDSLTRIWHLPELVRHASVTLNGRKVARNFVEKHWIVLIKTLNEVAGDFANVFEQSSDKDDQIQLARVMRLDKNNVASRKLEESKEALNANIHWKEKYLDKVVSWLKKRES